MITIAYFKLEFKFDPKNSITKRQNKWYTTNSSVLYTKPVVLSVWLKTKCKQNEPVSLTFSILFDLIASHLVLIINKLTYFSLYQNNNVYKIHKQ